MQTLVSKTSYICIVIKSRHTYLQIFLVALLLFATTGVTVSKHYCMGRLMSIEINDHAKGCQDEGGNPMPCCENTTEELRLEELQKTLSDVDLTAEMSIVHEVAYVLIDADPMLVTYPFIDLHAPPLITKDIPVLVQHFLI